jgi:TolA-binding protein
MKRYQDALLAFQSAIQNYDDREIAAQAQYAIGGCYKELEDLDNSVASYLKVINDYPDVTTADVQKLSIGIYFQEIQLYDLALKAFTQVAKLTKDPEIKLEAQYYIGETYYDAADFQQAILEFLKVTYMGFSPKNIWVSTARYKVAEIYESLGEWDKAMKIYQDLYTIFGSDKRGQKALERLKQIKDTQGIS